MKTKSNPPKTKERGFNAERFWRHYVAAVETDDASWRVEQEKGGNAGRIFMFLLLFHVFLIGAAILFNLVAERPRPGLVESTAPVAKPVAAAPKVTAPEKPKPPLAIPVVSRPDTVTADKAGTNRTETAKVNGNDAHAKLGSGSTTQVPNGQSALLQPAKIHHVTAAAQATTNGAKAGTAETFQATQPAPASSSLPKVAAPAPPVKGPAVADKLPADTFKAKTPQADTPPAPKPAATPAVAKHEEPQKAAPAKPEQEEKTLPVKSSATAKPAVEARTHTVKPKDTFYSISRKYHVPLNELMKINGVTDPGRLREGTTLKIPGK